MMILTKLDVVNKHIGQPGPPEQEVSVGDMIAVDEASVVTIEQFRAGSQVYLNPIGYIRVREHMTDIVHMIEVWERRNDDV